MKVVPKKYNTDAVLLSLNLTKHMTKVLKKQFDFIVEPAPEVTFYMCNDEMLIKSICFEAVDCCTDITINEDNILLSLPDGTSHLLYIHDRFENLFDMDEDDLYELEISAKSELEKAKEECVKLLKEMEDD